METTREHPDKIYHDIYDITYMGAWERENNFPLDRFRDNLTGASFLRRPMESLDAAVARTRQAFKKEIKEANNATA